MPFSRLLTAESLDNEQRASSRPRPSRRASLAVSAVALATTFTLVGAPAAEALGLI